MKQMLRSLPCLIAMSAIGASSTAEAHFRLTKPASWIVEDDLGDPQKAGPCGPAGSSGMMTNEITTVEAGSTIEVEYVETIHHPGWFRISLAEDRSEFEDVEFPNTNNCNYDMSTVPEEPHGNVLADGLAKDENLGGSNRTFKETVKIPNTPCEKCTLQVIQVMADAIHSPPGCIYYHCADLKIVAAAGGAAGSAAAAGSSGSTAAAGAAAPSSAGSGGASAASGGSSAPTSGAAGSSSASAGTGGTKAASGGAAAPTTPPAAAGTKAPATGTTTSPQGAAGTGTVATKPTSGSAGTSSPDASDPAPAESGGCQAAGSNAGGLLAPALLGLISLGLRSYRRRRAL